MRACRAAGSFLNTSAQPREPSTQHRDHSEVGCPAAALVSEVARQSAELQAAFCGGIHEFVSLAGDSLDR